MSPLRVTPAVLVLAAALPAVPQEKAGEQGLAPVMRAEQTDRQAIAEWERRRRLYFVPAGDRRLFDDATRSAWAFVASNYVPATGLVDVTPGYGHATVWDIGSGIAGLYSGHALKLIGDAEYDRRIRRVLATLRKLPIVDGAAFNKVYSTRSATMIDRAGLPSTSGYGWSTTDLGRLLIWLKVLAEQQPAYAAEAALIVQRLDFTRLVAGGYMWGQEFDSGAAPDRYQEGQVGYEQYAAAGFAAWGAPVERALRLEENGLPVTIMRRTLYADARGRDRLTSDPLVLLGLEVGWDPKMERFARDLLLVQEARHRQTGHLTVVAEDAISRPPHFFYYYSAYTHRRAFAVDVQKTGAFVDEPRWVSAKAAFAWHALLPRHYTRLAIQAVQPARNPGSWESGVFEGTEKSTGTPNVNTAAVILTAALYRQRGQPMLGVKPPRRTGRAFLRSRRRAPRPTLAQER